MITDIEIETIIYGILKGSALDLAIDGEIYTDKRPANSGKEDICIQYHDGLNGLYQEAIVNVNIYTQNQNRGSESIKDRGRIRELSQIAYKLLHGKVCNKYLIKVEKQNTFEVTATSEHATNIRLLLTHINF